MSDRVMRSKPAKHGKRLDGKKVLVYSGSKLLGSGIYHNDGRNYFRLESALGMWFLGKDVTTIEEIIETVE